MKAIEKYNPFKIIPLVLSSIIPVLIIHIYWAFENIFLDVYFIPLGILIFFLVLLIPIALICLPLLYLVSRSSPLKFITTIFIYFIGVGLPLFLLMGITSPEVFLSWKLILNLFKGSLFLGLSSGVVYWISYTKLPLIKNGSNE